MFYSIPSNSITLLQKLFTKFKMRSLASYCAIFILSSLLNACAIFGKPTEIDDTRTWSVEKIYQEAELQTRDKEYDKALRYYQVIESRYPYGKYAAQAQLEEAFTYYKKGDSVAAAAATDRFIKLHPNNANVDYAYYLKGLTSFNERGLLDKLTLQEINDRDPGALRASFNAFKELVTRFPNSRYTKDATLRMTYLVNALAANELHVARYYMQRKAYVAAVNRCKYLFEFYPNSTSIEDALVLSVSAYDAMSMDELKNDTLRILKTNYPKNPLLTGLHADDEKSWWKFWNYL